MRGKDYNTGLRGVLFEARHYERMGAALWLYGWLVLRQTHQQGNVGWVLGGSPVSYREIEDETGFNIRTLERWMQTLRRQGYVETEAVPAGVIVRITKAKKFPQAGRNSADTIRRVAGRNPQMCGANACNPESNHRATRAIGSSLIERSKEISETANSHRDFHNQPHNGKSQSHPPNPSCLVHNQTKTPEAEHAFIGPAHIQQQQRFLAEARLRLQLLRAEREEAVRRELAVGTGPEVRRS